MLEKEPRVYKKRVRLCYEITTNGIIEKPILVKNAQAMDGEVSQLVRAGMDLKSITIRPVWA